MKINIHTKNMELTEAIENYVNERVGSLKKLIKNADSTILAEVEIGKTTMHHNAGNVYRAELNISYSGVFLRAEATKEDLYAAIDEVKDEMMRELRQKKTKEESLFKRGAIKIKHLLKGISFDKSASRIKKFLKRSKK